MKYLSTLLKTIFLALLCSLIVSAQNKYIGVKACSKCHRTEKQGKQFDIWQKSNHANAYTTLTTARSDSIAKARELKKTAAESPECLKCHIIGNGVDTTQFVKGFNYKDGVQCETCHGAGSNYKPVHIMKDRQKSIERGMKEYKDQKAIEAFCKTCHNEKSPIHKEFKFKEAWQKIEHKVPNK